MMEEDDGQNILNEQEEAPSKERSTTVDLTTDSSLLVDISDALSEKDKVKFTVHTKTTLPDFQSSEFSVVREHEEFVWLHDRYVENEEYAGIIIPPTPPKPDFDASREKLQKLSEGENTMTKEEFQKMKAELEAEYLATFKKTVAMHEVFLCRLAAHPILRNDQNFKVFLEYKEDLCVKSRGAKDFLKGFAKGIVKGVDEKVLLAGQKDHDEFFENEKKSQLDYYTKVKDAALKSDKLFVSEKKLADILIKMSTSIGAMGTSESTDLDRIFNKTSEIMEKLRKIENRKASDTDLKLSDLLRYHMRDTEAAKDLLYRRMRCLHNLENANKNLDKARAKNKGVAEAEKAKEQATEKFDAISEVAKHELTDLRKNKVQAFKKNLVELSELQLKHSKAEVQLLKNTIAALKEGQ
ncbi:sorting nexin-6-like [Rhopilema esculentum]|uniref:sorting nexin-6-like n=1 Tax=Rhopilema esculentum TaxID=499914 RepID=UPI0031D9A185